MTRLLAAALVCSGCAMSWRYETPWAPDSELHTVTTADGWSITVRRFKPAHGPGWPVIAQHGILTNGRNMHLDDAHSIARSLSRDGYDVWVPSLRNTGESEHRSFALTPSEQLTFDAYVDNDMRAVVAYVREKTGAAQVGYVGHSMGGMILYAYLARGYPGIGRAVTLGAPLGMRWTGELEGLAKTFGGLGSAASIAGIRNVAHTTIEERGPAQYFVDRLLRSPDNIPEDSWKRFASVGIDDVPGPLIAQFSRWVGGHTFDANDGYDYAANLRKVTVPVLMIAGKIDGIAPPWVVKEGFEAYGAPEKKFLMVSEANGSRHEYNHMDLLIGDNAPREVFPSVARWLAIGRASR